MPPAKITILNPKHEKSVSQTLKLQRRSDNEKILFEPNMTVCTNVLKTTHKEHKKQ